MPRLTPLLVLALLPACRIGIPRFQATDEEEFQVPAAGLSGLDCMTHNGRVEVTGLSGSEEVRVKAERIGRGWTPEEAEAALARIQVRHEVKEGWLRVWWEEPQDDLWEDSYGEVAFTVSAPPALAAKLMTHNGAVEVRGVEGDVRVTSHNGRLAVRSSADALDLETHNGEIEAVLEGSGPVGGRITTHNGEITVAMGSREAELSVATHNGAIEVATAQGARASQSGGSVRTTVGAGGSELQVETHNGAVRVR